MYLTIIVPSSPLAIIGGDCFYYHQQQQLSNGTYEDAECSTKKKVVTKSLSFGHKKLVFTHFWNKDHHRAISVISVTTPCVRYYNCRFKLYCKMIIYSYYDV